MEGTPGLVGWKKSPVGSNLQCTLKPRMYQLFLNLLSGALLCETDLVAQLFWDFIFQIFVSIGNNHQV